MIGSEEQLQWQLAEYMRLQYPNVMYRSDMGGVRLSVGLRARMARLQSSRAWPDFFVAQPSNGYHGLFIELKREGVKIYTKKGTLVADAHVREQYATLKRLEQLGYQARFAIGFEQAQRVVDEYLSVTV